MTTLLISEVFPPRVGGSGRWFWEIYRRLPREGFAIAAGEDPRQEAFDRTHDLRLARAPLGLRDWGLLSPGELRGYWRACRAVRRVVVAEGVDQLHCGRCLPEGWIALMLGLRRRLPYLCFVHGEEINLEAAEDGHDGVMASRQIRWMTRLVLRNAGLVVANSRNTEGLLRRQWGLPADRLRVLTPGADTGRFVPSARDPGARDRLGWGDRPVVLTAGRLQKRKGHDRMILALAEIRRAIPDVLYAIVGDGEERPALQALVAREGLGGHVQFLGELRDENLVQCYQQCDLFVLPNRQVGKDIEGFGMVLVEAQACGKPVVAGASGGTAETMRVPETGRVVPCDDHRELAGVVAGLLAEPDLRARMGEAARRWAVERFDWDALSREAARLFRDESTPPGALSPAGRTMTISGGHSRGIVLEPARDE